MIAASVQHAMNDLDAAMGQYVGVSKRSIPEIIAQKGAQIIYGNKSPAYPGLGAALRELAPAGGSITTGRLSALRGLPRSASRPVKVRPIAKRRADALLGGEPSGMFSFFKVGAGGRFAVRKVATTVRGARRLTSIRGGKVRIDRKQTADAAVKRLNAPALSIAFELMAREAGRGYTAAGFNPRLYRKLLAFGRAQGATAKAQSMQAALDAPVPSANMTVVADNKTGQRLAHAMFSSAGNGAALRLMGFTPPQSRPAAQNAVARVLDYVRADTMTYVKRKLEKEQVAAFSKVRRIRA